MTELARYKEAVRVIFEELVALGLDEAYFTEHLRTKVSGILNPPPAEETVEVEGWAVLDKHGRNVGLCYYENDPLPPNGVKKVKLTGSYQRPVPRPVERSVGAIVLSRSAFTGCTRIEIPFNEEFPMAGTQVVITWTETPKGE